MDDTEEYPYIKIVNDDYFYWDGYTWDEYYPRDNAIHMMASKPTRPDVSYNQFGLQEGEVYLAIIGDGDRFIEVRVDCIRTDYIVLYFLDEDKRILYNSNDVVVKFYKLVGTYGEHNE